MGEMSDLEGSETAAVDFAVVAYCEEGVWQLEDLPVERADNLDQLTTELRRWPGDAGALGFVSVDEDFFLLVRVSGAKVRLLLSDITAADEWETARNVLEELDIPLAEEDDEDEPTPAGDLGIVADLGMGAMDMGVLIDDYDLYPDEMLSDIAKRLGFGAKFDEIAGLTPA